MLLCFSVINLFGESKQTPVEAPVANPKNHDLLSLNKTLSPFVATPGIINSPVGDKWSDLQ